MWALRSLVSMLGDRPPDGAPAMCVHAQVAELALPKPLVLWCSAGNPGAAEMVQELVASLAGGDKAANIRVVDSQPDARALEANGESAAMLLYLNKDTWQEGGEVLERDVRAAMNARVYQAATKHKSRRSLLGKTPPTPGQTAPDHPEASLKIVMVHENDANKGGCEFGTFFATTPSALIDEGIFNDIAIALHTSPHRSVSLGLVAQALGAVKKSSLDRASRRFSSWLSVTPVAKGVKKAPNAAESTQAKVPAASSSTELIALSSTTV